MSTVGGYDWYVSGICKIKSFTNVVWKVDNHLKRPAFAIMVRRQPIFKDNINNTSNRAIKHFELKVKINTQTDRSSPAQDNKGRKVTHIIVCPSNLSTIPSSDGTNPSMLQPQTSPQLNMKSF